MANPYNLPYVAKLLKNTKVLANLMREVVGKLNLSPLHFVPLVLPLG